MKTGEKRGRGVPGVSHNAGPEGANGILQRKERKNGYRVKDLVKNYQSQVVNNYQYKVAKFMCTFAPYIVMLPLVWHGL